MSSQRPNDPDRVPSSEAFWEAPYPNEFEHTPVIAGFRIEEEIGRGSFGRVFRARQAKPDRAVAIKVLRPGAENSDRRRRFELEAEVLGQMHHPGIAQIYQFGTTQSGHGPQPYFVMELVRGAPITEYARAHQLSIDERLQIAIRLCEAVQHTHELGFVHRDLKPSNVLVEDGGRPKVLDFGLARWIDGDLPEGLRAMRGRMIGTLQYASPEQVDGRGHEADARSDVYSLGVIVYELLTGRRPHNLEGVSLLFASQILAGQDPIPAGEVEPGVGIDLQSVLAQALSPEPGRRYADAGAFGRDLLHAARHEPVNARPDSRLYRFSRLVRRNRGVALALTMAFLFLGVGLLGTSIGLWRAARAEERRLAQYEHARDAVVNLGNKFVREIENRLDGAEERRVLLEDHVLPELKHLRAQDPSDRALKETHAYSLRVVGNLDRLSGHSERAEGHRAESLELYNELHSENPDEVESYREWLIARVLIGDLYKERAQIRKAYRYYEDVLEEHEHLRAAHPDHWGIVDDLSWSYERMMVLSEGLEDHEAAADYRGKRHKLALLALEQDPNQERARYNFATSFAGWEDPPGKAANLQAAAGYFQEKLHLYEELANDYPDNFKYLHGLAHAGLSLARIEMQLENVEAVLRHLARFVPMFWDWVDRRPGDSELLVRAAQATREYVEALQFSGDHSEATENARTFLSQAQRVARRVTNSAGPLRALGRAHLLLSSTLSGAQALRQLELAKTAFWQMGEQSSASREDLRDAVSLLANQVEGEEEVKRLLRLIEKAQSHPPAQPDLELLRERLQNEISRKIPVNAAHQSD